MTDPKEGCHEDTGDEDDEAGCSRRQSDSCGKETRDWNSFGTAGSAM